MSVIVVVLATACTAQAAAQESKRSAIQYRWDEHPEIRAGRALTLEFHARVQVDAVRADRPGGHTSATGWGLRRVGVQGDISRSVEFELDYELADLRTRWRDAFVNLHRVRALQVQAGRFKVPFSQDELTSSATHDFAYRSRAADLLAPGRDQGVMVHGEAFGRRLGYEVGIFAHDGENARLNNPDRSWAGRTSAVRVTGQPFRNTNSILEDLRVGFAQTSGTVAEGLPSIRGRSPLDQPFYDAVYWTAGSRQRTGVEARWRPGPFSLKAEYIRLSDERLGQDVDAGDLPPIVGSGWYVSGTWAVTGEDKAGDVARPRRPIPGGGPGTIELAVRVEGIHFDSPGSADPPATSPRAATIAGGSARLVTLGVNWHPVRWGRVLWNLVREDTRASGHPLPATRSWFQIVRLQLSL